MDLHLTEFLQRLVLPFSFLLGRSLTRMRIEGQCPRCTAWFDADDWFDDDAPVPCCPRCGLVPGKLAYVHGSGRRVERVLTIDLVASEQWLG